MMGQALMRNDPADDTFAFQVAVRLLAVFLGVIALGGLGAIDGAGALALGAGLAAGAAAPRRWAGPLGATAAAAALSTIFAGLGSTAAALMVLPGALAGWWVMHRAEPGDTATWPDGVLAGFTAEAMLLFAMLFAAVPIAAISYLLTLGNGTGFGVMAGVGFLLAAGWMHAGTGRMVHRMLPGAFWKFAAGQALPSALLALAVHEAAPALMIIALTRLAFIWFGYLHAENVDRARAALIAGKVSPCFARSEPAYREVRGVLPLGS
ncbi:MAG TPA: hypothetical protein VFR81_13995 [Longimicrobium sp.]|nr:hypothetical protein [Longimicrobium sp.]